MFGILFFLLITNLKELHSSEDNEFSSVFEDEEKNVIIEWSKELTLPKNYKPNRPPKCNGNFNATELNITIDPIAIGDLNMEHMEFEAQFFITLKWTDCRLNTSEGEKGIIAVSTAKQLWIPILEYRNCIRCQPLQFNFITHTLELEGDSFLFHSRRTATVYCKYDLSAYPMDRQRCEVEIQPNKPKFMVSLVTANISNLLLWSDMTPPQFKIENIGVSQCSKENHQSSIYSCIEIYFELQREIAYHVIVTFLPSFLIVWLTWVTFWLDVDASAPRVTLCLTSMLALITQFISVQRGLPSVSYVKAIDVWMFSCIFMVFAALIEFAAANYNFRKGKAQQISPTPVYPVTSEEQISESANKKAQKAKKYFKQQFKISNIDRTCRVLFPAFFGIFSIFYWCYYLI